MASPIEQLFALQDVDSRLQALNTQMSDLEKAADTVAEQATETRRRADAQRQEIADHDKPSGDANTGRQRFALRRPQQSNRRYRRQTRANRSLVCTSEFASSEPSRVTKRRACRRG